MKTYKELFEKKLTPAELKKREEIAQAMEKENPGMNMGKKMAIATATAKRVAEGSLNEVTQGVEHSEWADNVRDAHPGVKIIKKRTEDGRHIKSQAILNGQQLVGQYNMNTGVGTFKAPKQQGVAEALTYTQKHSSWSVHSPKKNEFNKTYKLDQEKEARAHAERIGGKLVKIDQHGHTIRANKKLSEDVELDESLKTHYQNGYDAQKKGKSRQDNPHREGSPAASMWAKGWEHSSDKKEPQKFTNEEVELDEMTQGKSYSQKQLSDKIKSGDWEATQDIKPGKHVEMRHHSGKRVTVHVKEDTMEKQSFKQFIEKINESVECLDEEQRHKVNVTVSDPNHPAVTQRKEQTLKRVVVTAGDKATAIDKAKAFYKKKGYKVHDAEHHSVVSESVEEGLKPDHNMRPGWMLKADPALAAKVKANIDKEKAKRKALGNPSAGKSEIKEEELDEEKDCDDKKMVKGKKGSDKIKFNQGEEDGKHIGEEVDLDEAHKLGSQVEIIKGSAKGTKGHIGEIRHGAYKGAPKTYTVFHGENGAVQVPKEHIRAIKEEALDEVEGKVYQHKGSYGSSYDGDDEKKKPESGVKRGRGRPKKGSDESGEVKKFDFSAFMTKVKLPAHKGAVTKHNIKG